MFHDVPFIDALHYRHSSQNGVQRPKPKRRMLENRNSMMPRSICFQENLTAYLMYFTVLKIAAEQFD